MQPVGEGRKGNASVVETYKTQVWIEKFLKNRWRELNNVVAFRKLLAGNKTV
jgi:hypothetical protein